jgi:branched-subunit amino acid ABC-type transport system permease component
MINQFIVNGIIAGSVYTLVAVGFAVIYRRSGFSILLMG